LVQVFESWLRALREEEEEEEKWASFVIMNYIPNRDYPSIKNDHQVFLMAGCLLNTILGEEQHSFTCARARITKLEKMRKRWEDVPTNFQVPKLPTPISESAIPAPHPNALTLCALTASL
jgi:hypothetical protein